MGIHRKTGIPAVTQRSIERFVATIILLLMPICLFSGDLELEYEISNNPVGVKDNIYLTIFVDVPDPGKVAVTAPPLPKEIRIISGPKIDKVAHQGAFRTRISYRLRGEETGRYIIKPFLVSADTRKVETETQVLEVGRYRNRVIYVPLELQWQVPDEPIYVGQSVPVTLRLLGLTEIPLVESLKIDPPNGAFFEEYQGFGEIETVPAGEKSLYNVPVASYIFTPSQSGRLFLPSAEVEALGESAASPVVRIDVRSLPATVRQSGAIGNFTFNSWIDKPVLDVGSVGVLSMIVEGSGNIGYFNMPNPDFGELVETETSDAVSALPSQNGYLGTRRMDIKFLSEAAGEYMISVPDFGYFDPATETAGMIQGASYRVVFESIAEISAEPVEAFPFALPSHEEMIAPAKWGVYRKPLNYLWLIPAPLTFLVLLILKRTRVAFVSIIFFLTGAGGDIEEPDRLDLSPAIEAYNAADYEEAQRLFESSFLESPVNPGLGFALALAEYRAGNIDDAIFHVRSAIRLDPMSTRYRSFLRWLNDKQELEKLVYPGARIHPDLFFFGMVIFLSAAFASGAVYLMKRKGIYIVFFLLGLLLSAGSCGGLVQSAIIHDRSTAIVYGGPAEVRRIPNSTAASWIELPTGYSLRILDHTGEFCLIQTGYGLSGWVERTSLLEDTKG